MKNLKWMIALITMAISAQAWAEGIPVVLVTPQPTLTEKNLVPPAALPTTAPPPIRYSAPALATPSPTPSNEVQLAGRVGFGTGYLPYGNGGLRSESVRLWLSQDFCLDAEGYYTGTTNNDYDFNENPVQYPNYTYAFGLGFKYNLKEPTKNLFVQLIVQGSYANYYDETIDIDEQQLVQDQYVGLFVGVGFEYFVPFFDSISLESSIGYSQSLEFSSSSINYNPNLYSTTNYNSTGNYYSSNITVNGMTLSSLIIHFYF